jgi:murein DD-endopeptidase MepM/ murein hydrolase activator NlpD
MTLSVSNGQTVTAGQVIGHLDSSGCQSGAHLHIGRKDPGGTPVNFTIPCVNSIPTTKFDDGTVGDDVPATL